VNQIHLLGRPARKWMNASVGVAEKVQGQEAIDIPEWLSIKDQVRKYLKTISKNDLKELSLVSIDGASGKKGLLKSLDAGEEVSLHFRPGKRPGVGGQGIRFLLGVFEPGQAAEDMIGVQVR
jgi:hypothetical protein